MHLRRQRCVASRPPCGATNSREASVRLPLDPASAAGPVEAGDPGLGRPPGQAEGDAWTRRRGSRSRLGIRSLPKHRAAFAAPQSFSRSKRTATSPLVPPPPGGAGAQLHRHLHDDPERAVAADEELGQGRSRRTFFHDLAAALEPPPPSAVTTVMPITRVGAAVPIEMAGADPNASAGDGRPPMGGGARRRGGSSEKPPGPARPRQTPPAARAERDTGLHRRREIAWLVPRAGELSRLNPRE